MNSTHIEGDERLLSRSEVAAVAGVMRPAVTNWERRHEDYPEPVRTGDAELFVLGAVVRWLDSRRIPARARTRDEPPGSTYGDRARRNLRAAHGDLRAGPQEGPADGPEDETERASRLERLLGPLADAVRGGASTADCLALLMALVFLRASGDPQWAALLRKARAGHAGGSPALLRDIGEAADGALRRRGVTPGLRTRLLRLEPRAHRHLAEVVLLADGLGIDAFRVLLDRFGEHAALPSDEFFTPRAVVRLMRDASVTGDDPVREVYDPYARGGEMLDGAAALLAGRGTLTLRGESPHRETLRYAGMNLALHGVTCALGAGTAAPWAAPAWAPAGTADLVLTNPPFSLPGAAPRPRHLVEWPYGPPPPGSSVFGWLQHVLMSLADGGRACVVMPVSAGASADHRERAIRGALVAAGAVECVMALPPRLFPGTEVSVCLWFLRRSGPAREEILFVDASALGVKPPRGPRVLPDEQVAELVATVRSWRAAGGFVPGRQAGGHLAAAVSRESVAAPVYSLSPMDHVGHLDHWMSAPASDAVRQAAEAGAELREAGHRAAAADGAVGALAFAPGPSASAPPHGERPAGPRRVRLGDLVQRKAGPSYTRLPAGVRTAAGRTPVVMPKHLRGGRISDRDLDGVDPDLAASLRDFRLVAGDILCVRSGTQVPPALVEPAQEGWLFGTNLMRLRPAATGSGPQFDPDYLLAYLSMPDTVRWLGERARGTAVPSLSAATLGQLDVPLPPLAEQRRIAAVLGAIDAQIAAHRELVGTATRLRTSVATHLMTGALTPR